MGNLGLSAVSAYRPLASHYEPEEGEEEQQAAASSNPLLKPGCPVQLDSEIIASPITADVDGDGEQEIVVTTRNGIVYTLFSDCSLLSSFDLPSGSDLQVSPSAGDLNLDGKLEMVSLDRHSARNVLAWDYYNNILSGWPVTGLYASGDSGNAVTLADIDNNGALESVFSGQDASLAPQVFVYKPDGTPLSGFPASMGPGMSSHSSCPVGDINNDGYLEIVAAGQPYLRAFSHDGSKLWEVVKANQSHHAPIIANLDQSGDPEIVVSEWYRIYALTSTGNFVPGWPQSVPGLMMGTNFAAGDFSGNSNLEVFHTSTDTTPVFAWNNNGTSVSGFSVDKGSDEDSMCSLGDINNDGSPEVVCGIGLNFPNVGAWDNSGNMVENFPLATSGGVIQSSPIITDLDNDGYVDIVATDYDGKVYVWDLGLADPPVPYNAVATPWPMFQHDARHTGNYDADVTPPTVSYPLPSPVPFTVKTDYNFSIANGNPLVATDYVGVSKCRVFYKEGDNYTPGYLSENMTSTFSWSEMHSTDGTNWTGTIPGEAITPAGLQYYFVCWDSSVNPRINPLGAPDAGDPYIATSDDIIDPILPTISHFPITQAPVFEPIEIEAEISDNSGEEPLSYLFYRTVGTASWQQTSMACSGDDCAATIPANYATMDGVEYYIEATDWKLNVQTTPVYSIEVYDDTAPEINFTPVEELAYGKDLIISAEITDNVGLNDAELYFRSVGGNFAPYLLDCSQPPVCTAIIPNVVEDGEYYLRADDTSGNEAFSPDEAPDNYYTVTVTDLPDDDDDNDDDTIDDDDDTTPVDDDDDNDDDTTPVNNSGDDDDDGGCGC